MLKSILSTPLEKLQIGAREHALLAVKMPDSIDACFERDDWTCHVCGIRLPLYMEVDHINGHQPCSAEDLRTICQFCHNIQHAIWAANRKRLKVIWAPSSKQSILTILAWQLLLSAPTNNIEIVDEDLVSIAKAIAESARRRELILSDIIGASHAGGLLEALLSIKRLKSQNEFQEIVDRLDKYVRFWPSASYRIIDIHPEEHADFGHWREDGFHSLSDSLIEEFRKSTTSLNYLMSLCESHHPLRI